MKEAISEEYFLEVVNKERDLMFRLAFGILRNVADTEDAVAESVLKAWEKRRKLKNPQKLRSWILRIVINTAKTMAVKNGRTVLVNDDQMFENQEEHTDYNLWSLVEQLVEKEKVIILLYYYREFSIKEIAEILKVPEGTVKSRLYKAREHLKTLLLKYD